jgi:glycosyltransferase involved in cell wall biosynthesis
MASLFCKNVKVMCLMHGLNRCRNWRRKLFFSLFGKRVDRFIGCSSRVAEDIKKYPGVREDQVVSIANSTDYEKHAGVEFDPKARSEFGFYDDDFVFINVGRLVETKGLEYLLEAFEMVAKERPQARLLIVGSGRLREHLEQSAPDGVVFAGFRRDVTRLMKAGDCFVLSSIREGMPLVIFEAMSAGIPVVTTNTGAAEQVEGPDGEKYGFLCPIADSRSLAAAMKEAMDMTPVRRDDLVRKAARRVEKEYSHAAAVENLKNLYQKVYEENR